MRQEERIVRWQGWTGTSSEELRLGFENGGWTADGLVTGADVHYVLRCDAAWRLRQVLLFRDLDEPDLWLVTDGEGRWAEVNGGGRPDLQGCTAADLPCTPFTTALPLAGVEVAVGDSVDVRVATIDTETLLVVPGNQRFTRLSERRWRRDLPAHGWWHEFDVDADGLVVDDPGTFRRTD